MRQRKMAIELASDIGARAYDLLSYSDAEAIGAFVFLWKVNPEVFKWLKDRLAQAESLAAIVKDKT